MIGSHCGYVYCQCAVNLRQFEDSFLHDLVKQQFLDTRVIATYLSDVVSLDKILVDLMPKHAFFYLSLSNMCKGYLL